jgi:hypothetical protein
MRGIVAANEADESRVALAGVVFDALYARFTDAVSV